MAEPGPQAPPGALQSQQAQSEFAYPPQGGWYDPTSRAMYGGRLVGGNYATPLVGYPPAGMQAQSQYLSSFTPGVWRESDTKIESAMSVPAILGYQIPPSHPPPQPQHPPPRSQPPPPMPYPAPPSPREEAPVDPPQKRPSEKKKRAGSEKELKWNNVAAPSRRSYSQTADHASPDASHAYPTAPAAPSAPRMPPAAAPAPAAVPAAQPPAPPQPVPAPPQSQPTAAPQGDMTQLYARQQHAYPYPTYQTRVSVENIFHQLQAHIMQFDPDTQQRLAQLMLKDFLQRNLLPLSLVRPTQHAPKPAAAGQQGPPNAAAAKPAFIPMGPFVLAAPTERPQQPMPPHPGQPVASSPQPPPPMMTVVQTSMQSRVPTPPAIRSMSSPTGSSPAIYPPFASSQPQYNPPQQAAAYPPAVAFLPSAAGPYTSAPSYLPPSAPYVAPGYATAPEFVASTAPVQQQAQPQTPAQAPSPVLSQSPTHGTQQQPQGSAQPAAPQTAPPPVPTSEHTDEEVDDNAAMTSRRGKEIVLDGPLPKRKKATAPAAKKKKAAASAKRAKEPPPAPPAEAPPAAPSARKDRKPAAPRTPRKIGKSRKAANVWSAESDLAQVDLRDVVNPSTFALLLPKQKDELLQLLPKVDTVDETTITAVFTNPQFTAIFSQFQKMLQDGEFERGLDLPEPRKEELRGWKKKYFEEYWGEKQEAEKRAAELAEEASLPRYSYAAHAPPPAEQNGEQPTQKDASSVSPVSPPLSQPPNAASDESSSEEEPPPKRSGRFTDPAVERGMRYQAAIEELVQLARPNSFTATQAYEAVSEKMPGRHSFSVFRSALDALCFATDSSVTIVGNTPHGEALYGSRPPAD